MINCGQLRGSVELEALQEGQKPRTPTAHELSALKLNPSLYPTVLQSIIQSFISAACSMHASHS